MTLGVVDEFAPIDYECVVSSRSSETLRIYPTDLILQFFCDGRYCDLLSLPEEDPRSVLRGVGGHSPRVTYEAVDVAAGATERWHGQYANWRCCAFPGRYRLRATVVAIDNARRVPGVPGAAGTVHHGEWIEFAVTEQASGCAALRAARDNRGREWASYRMLMEEVMDVDALRASSADEFVRKVGPVLGGWAWKPDEVAALQGLDGLPSGLKRRSDIAQALRDLRLGRTAGSSQERVRLLSGALVAGGALSVGGESSYDRTLGALIELSAAEASGNREVVAESRRRCLGDTEVQAAVRAMGDGVRSWLDPSSPSGGPGIGPGPGRPR